jgi:hypothetical protein
MKTIADQHTEAGAFERVPLDQKSVPSAALDLNGRQRTNPFPWRGQFSPELVELVISTSGIRCGTVLDSFAGVGTTLWESARLGLDSVGTEINPAALTMAQSVRFIPLSPNARRSSLDSVRNGLAGRYSASPCGPLFNRSESPSPDGATSVAKGLADAVAAATDDLERIVLSNILLRTMAASSSPSIDSVFREFSAYSGAILGLPHARHQPSVVHADARDAPVADGSIDLVLTSPPYINVFNYHQNGREAMEVLGWDLLRVARSEFGANRKHRGNRFLTVVQYALDMTEWLAEMRRVLARNGRAIVVIGRESMVRGVAFRNGELLAALAESAGFRLTLRQERKFVTRFGETIFEDILHFRIGDAEPPAGLDVARRIAVAALRSVMGAALAPDVASDLRAAIAEASAVRPSPRMRTGRASCPTP